MYEAIQSILTNIAIIFVMHLFINLLIVNRENLTRPILFPVGIISITSLAVISIMYFPIHFGEFRFDLRLIPLVILGFKWGWKYAIPTLIITGLWRLNIGGEGAILGVIFGMTLPILVSLLFHRWKKAQLSIATVLYIVTFAWLVSDVPMIFILPDGFTFFTEYAFYRYVSLLFTTLALAFFIKSAEKEIDLKEQLKFYAEHDSLTGLYNVRRFEKMVQLTPKSKKEEREYIAMLDIDHFKKINDTFGHISGDIILRRFSEIILEHTLEKNKHSIVGRYGGEEFIIHVKGENEEEIRNFAESLIKKVENSEFLTKDSTVIRVTVSIGLAELDKEDNLYKTIALADRALYEAKNKGRNQYIIWNN
ncbi:GGDEF domain-containing protein [Bacillus alkalisoli]|uniref:GGDEF domain-containing protein n=1 Tax=Bacillus alkalisoli TaxID=2011008 RepID=UPI000C23BFAB|nr:diguanylate cyclase [Bacillus alkalisoli]